MSTKIKKVTRKLPLTIPILLILLGVYLFVNVFFKQNFPFALSLFIAASFSMYVAIQVWRWFASEYATKVIYWTTSHKYVRKIIAGGSFTYYEYKEDKEKIGNFEPLSRFINLLIAFLGLTTSIAKIANFAPDSPVADTNSLMIWTLFLIFVPLILAPVIPIIWVMEDLKLKAWNKKTAENWRVSTKYKKRFNSFITIGSLSVGLGLTGTESADPLVNLQVYANILLSGIILLVYPVSVLTLLYYLSFRDNVNREVREQMNIVTAKTILEIVDPVTGEEILTEENKRRKNRIKRNDDEIEDVEEEEVIKKEIKEKDLKVHQKIGKGTKKSLTTLNKKTFGRVGKLVKKKKKPVKKSKQKKTGGSATKGLWDNED